MAADPAHRDYLLVGRIGRAVGLRGEVEVAIDSDDPQRFAAGSVVLEAKGLRRLTVRSLRRNRNRTVVAFEEVTDRTGAEALRGADLVVAAEHARALGPDEYWDHDLIGCSVDTIGGDEIGRVTDVLHAPANDVLVVAGPQREHLIPLISDVVKTVEPGRRITIDPIPGLLE